MDLIQTFLPIIQNENNIKLEEESFENNNTRTESLITMHNNDETINSTMLETVEIQPNSITISSKDQKSTEHETQENIQNNGLNSLSTLLNNEEDKIDASSLGFPSQISSKTPQIIATFTVPKQNSRKANSNAINYISDKPTEIEEDKLDDIIEYIAEDISKNMIKHERIDRITEFNPILGSGSSESDIRKIYYNKHNTQDDVSPIKVSRPYDINIVKNRKELTIISKNTLESPMHSDTCKEEMLQTFNVFEYNLSTFVISESTGNITKEEGTANENAENSDVIKIEKFHKNGVTKIEDSSFLRNSEGTAFNEDIESYIPMYKIENNVDELIDLTTDEIVDLISISSTEETLTETDNELLMNPAPYDNTKTQNSDDEDGYNSSDFEFITEMDAKMEGFIVNLNLDRTSSSDFERTFAPSQILDEANNFIEQNDLGEGPSGLNNHNIPFLDRSYRENHEIPDDDGYFNLFQGLHNPALPYFDSFFMENKSIRTSVMNCYDGMGFDKQLAAMRQQPDSSEEEFAEDAKESIKKILFMYPGENKKRRRSGRR